MQLQILKLIIWPKKTNFTPRVVPFQPGVLNVITGSSRTGKSAIIPIIDYCLASSDCFIPIDTIRDHASWYGVVFQTQSEEILFARRVPSGTKASNEFFVLRGTTISIPSIVSNANEKLDGVKNILNTISSVPFFSLERQNDRNSYRARLGFRDLMALVFQNQDIVANQNILFYKTHAHAHRERLRNWFPFILGAEDIEVLKARHRLQVVEQELKQLKRKHDQLKEISSRWMDNMLGHLRVAREYGLLDEVFADKTDPEELLFAAKRIVENIPNHSNSKSEDILTTGTEMVAHEKEEDENSAAIGLVKRRLNDIKRLRAGFIDYGNAISKRVDRLHISQWLIDVSSESQSCPACGSSEHPRSNEELAKITEAFKLHEDESKGLEEIPTSFFREEEQLTSKLIDLLRAQKAIQNRYDIKMSRDRHAQEEFQNRKNMFVFLGHLKASLETHDSLANDGELQEEITQLENESKSLLKVVDRVGVGKRVNAATSKITQKMLNHLATLDVEKKYRETAPRFCVEDLNVSVLSSDGNWHYLAEVGSASNWVSFHLALFCSLQEFFTEQKYSPVPNFVIFDQPSQVYFPTVKREGDDQDGDPKYKDVDVNAVTQMFKTVADSILNAEGKWQGIVLDHADRSIYGALEGVHEVGEWRGDIKLIPKEWYR